MSHSVINVASLLPLPPQPQGSSLLTRTGNKGTEMSQSVSSGPAPSGRPLPTQPDGVPRHHQEGAPTLAPTCPQQVTAEVDRSGWRCWPTREAKGSKEEGLGRGATSQPGEAAHPVAQTDPQPPGGLHTGQRPAWTAARNPSGSAHVASAAPVHPQQRGAGALTQIFYRALN